MKKEDEKDMSAVAVNNTIQLFFKDEKINVQKDQSPELFERVLKLLRDGNIEEIKRSFFEIKAELERYTKGKFHVGDGGNMYLKGDSEPIPAIIAKKLKEMRDQELDFMPLVRFWKKLKENPDPGVKEQLYAFMQHNHIPITPLGDVICEKGVKETKNGTLIDMHSGTIDNSIGMVVEVPRDSVDKDPNKTCSTGLHVGAPDYVRNHWNSDVIVEVEVHPRDYVAIPKDYNETKARVCRYKVIGIAKKNPRAEIVYNFDDVIAPTHKALHDQKQRGKSAPTEYTDAKDGLDYNKMTAKAIIDYVHKIVGIRINTDVKNKQSVIKKAEKMLSGAKSWKHINVADMTAKEIADLVYSLVGKRIGGKKPWRKDVIYRGNKLCAAIQTKLID